MALTLKTNEVMRQIRHLLTMAALAVMGAMMAGCASEDNIIADPQQPAGPTGPLTLTTTVTLGDGANTRALTEGGVKTFKVGDQIAVKYTYDTGIDKTELSAPLEETDISNEGKTATFTVTLTETPDAGCDVRYVYPAAMGEDWSRDNMIQNDQDGTLTTLASKFDYCEGSGTMGGTAPDFVLPTGVTLKNQLTLAKFTVSDGSNDITSGVTQLMIEDGTRGYVVNRTAAAGPILVAMYPIASTQKIKVTAIKGTAVYQNGDITGKTLAKNNYYDITVTTPKIDMSSISDADLKQPLTFEAKEDDTKVKFTLAPCVKQPVEYSTDGGTTWATYTSETEISLASARDKVMFRGNNAAYSDGGNHSTFSVTSGGCYVYGNVMSLVNATAFPLVKALTANYAFCHLFDGCGGIHSHESNKIVLPATTLTESCYFFMFKGCSSLTTAPALPATTLVDYCYSNMFSDCANLTTAPDLPATTLVDNCYSDMFNGCSSLNYVKCLATVIPADNCTGLWLLGVPDGGTFIISDDLNSSNPAPWTRDVSGIPNGWTVKCAKDENNE